MFSHLKKCYLQYKNTKHNQNNYINETETKQKTRPMMCGRGFHDLLQYNMGNCTHHLSVLD